MDEMERLSWRDKFVRQLVQTLEGYDAGDCEDAIPQVISGEDNIVVLRVSLDEWTKLYSSAFTGADICYPSESDSVRWILNRALECPVSLCDLIADCIATSDGVKEAIRDFVTTDTEINNYITNVSSMSPTIQIESELIAGSCDNSVLAGKMIALVERLDLNNIDALEQIEVGTNDEERVSNIIEGIPGLGELPIDDILEGLQAFLEDFTENYAAASTVERRDALARDLWCYAKEQPDCAVTYEGLFDFFQTRATTNLSTISTLIDIIGFLFDGDFNNDDLLFNTMFAAQIAFVNAGRAFYGINLPKIGSITRDAEPSTAWLDWDECAPSEACVGGEYINFRASNAAFTPYVDRAAYVSGQGWTKGVLPASPARISIYRGMAPTPTNLRLFYSAEVGEVRFYTADGTGNPLASLGADSAPAEQDDGTWMYQMSPITTSHTGNFLIDAGVAGDLAGIYLRRLCWNYDE